MSAEQRAAVSAFHGASLDDADAIAAVAALEEMEDLAAAVAAHRPPTTGGERPGFSARNDSGATRLAPDPGWFCGACSAHNVGERCMVRHCRAAPQVLEDAFLGWPGPLADIQYL